MTAIEQRDKTTSGHSGRVAELTVGLAEKVDALDDGPFRELRFTRDQLQEIRYASLLHDFGKVGVREKVLVKAKKLPPGQLEIIRQRGEIIRRGLELRHAARKTDWLLQHGRDGFEARAAAWDADLAQVLADLDQHLKAIAAANEPTVMPGEISAGILELAGRSFLDYRGDSISLLTPEEARILSIARGSLTSSTLFGFTFSASSFSSRPNEPIASRIALS